MPTTKTASEGLRDDLAMFFSSATVLLFTGRRLKGPTPHADQGRGPAPYRHLTPMLMWTTPEPASA